MDGPNPAKTIQIDPTIKNIQSSADISSHEPFSLSLEDVQAQEGEEQQLEASEIETPSITSSEGASKGESLEINPSITGEQVEGRS